MNTFKKNLSFQRIIPMFYVEHIMKCLIYIAVMVILTACAQKDPNPELLDGIYKDLVAELDLARRSLELEEKSLLDLVKEKSIAIPQTGQIKFAIKKISDAEEKIMIMKQRVIFFEISVAQRVGLARIKYGESLRTGGKPWPDKEEVALYNSATKFQRDKLEWERNRGIKKIVPRGTPPKGN